MASSQSFSVSTHKVRQGFHTATDTNHLQHYPSQCPPSSNVFPLSHTRYVGVSTRVQLLTIYRTFHRNDFTSFLLLCHTRYVPVSSRGRMLTTFRLSSRISACAWTQSMFRFPSATDTNKPSKLLCNVGHAEYLRTINT